MCDKKADLIGMSREQREACDRAAASAEDRRRLVRNTAQHTMNIVGQQVGCRDLGSIHNRGMLAPSGVISHDGVVRSHQIGQRCETRAAHRCSNECEQRP